MTEAKDTNILNTDNRTIIYSEEQRIRDEIWAREDFIRCQNDRKNYYESEIAARDAALAEKDVVIADKEATIADIDATIAVKDATIADKDATIEHLKAILIANGINPDDNQ